MAEPVAETQAAETPLWAHDAAALARGFARGAWSAEAIVEAFIARADAIEPRINGFTHRLQDEARARARAQDRARRGGATLGPLAGVPLTVKDNIDVDGLPSTMGLIGRSAHRASADATLVKLARAGGAILLGKTNVPQAMLSSSVCHNPVYGATHNPWRLSHGPGGTSSGEGALIAAGASALGIGTDFGGSVRFPAAYCGLVGMLTTPGRWSRRGVHSMQPGQGIIVSQPGPLARSVGDAIMLLRALDGRTLHTLDPEVPPVALGTTAPPSLAGRRIGFYTHDGFFTASSACVRAVEQARAALSAAGAELVEMAPPNQAEVVSLYLAAVGADGGAGVAKALAGEPISPVSKTSWQAAKVPDPVRRRAGPLLARLGQERLGLMLSRIGRKSARDWWALHAERDALRRAEQAAWDAAGIDAMLCPATATPPLPADEAPTLAPIFSYTQRYNLMGFPAGVLPMTVVRPGEPGGRPSGGDRFERAAARVDEASVGLPVAVQVVGRPWAEGTILGIMALLEATARRGDAPRVPVRVIPDGAA